MSCDNDSTGPLILADITEWRSWLVSNESTCDGIWLVLAKKGVTNPTSLTYQEALEEALCSGWIDGRRKTVDADTFQQRFTPPAHQVDLVATQRRDRRAASPRRTPAATRSGGDRACEG
ncbi:hypothetical protein GCM10009696_35600 [Kocuria himachalensis]